MQATTIGIYAVTAAIGLWEFVSGRGVPGRSPRGVRGSVLRIFGAVTMLASVVAIVLSATGDQGFAFLTFGVTALAVAAFAGATGAPRTTT